jgi:hypothetical protein
MISISKRLHVCFMLAILVCLQSFAQGGKTLRVFLIGNSFSQNASRFLPQITQAGGNEIVIGRAELGGCPLQRHWDSVEVNLRDSTRGKAYNGKSLKELLSAGKWDVVTIQQYSLLSGDEETYKPYAQKLYDFIQQVQPGVEVVVHQTWPYRADAKSFGRIKGATTAKTQTEMWEKSRAAYHALAKQLGGLRIIPSGDAFYTVATDSKWAFIKDTAYNYDNPEAPALPADRNSLNVGYTWGSDKKLKFDPNHANEAGCYLAGLVWYGILFKADPAKISYKPQSVPDEFAAFLRKTAQQTVAAAKQK